MLLDMFTVEDRARIRQELIEMARADPRIVSGAEMGSLTQDAQNRWGDLDLTFGVADGESVEAVFDGWTETLRVKHDAIRLFDLPHRGTQYRVFLFPGNLQVDLSLTPGAVVQMGPKFRVLFGDRVTDIGPLPQDRRELLGIAVHDALRTRLYVERGRLHHAVYCLGELRNGTLSVASLNRDLPGRYGRGFDDLPQEVRDRAAETLVGGVEPQEILRALTAAIGLLIAEARGIPDIDVLEPRLRELTKRTL